MSSAKKWSQLPAVSLFSGSGGLDVGARAAGFRTEIALELDKFACATLEQNGFAKSNIINADIRDVNPAEILRRLRMKKGELPLLFGGPPCQSFSKAAYWISAGEEAQRRRLRAGIARNVRGVDAKSLRDPSRDERTSMLSEFLRMTIGLRPRQFLLENVVSLSHPSNRRFMETFIRDANSAGYRVSYFKLNASHFGVPQIRERIFIVGKYDDEPASAPRALPMLPPVSTSIRPFRTKRFFEPEEVVEGRWADALFSIPPGMNYKALTKWANHPRPLFEAETRFWNFLLKLHPERPSWTLAASPGPWVGPFHWNNRRLRIPEMAAIQTFPEDYKFVGSRREKVKQIGNAVPPQLAAAVMREIALRA